MQSISFGGKLVDNHVTEEIGQSDPLEEVFFFPACSLSPPGGDRGECGGRDRSIFLFFKGHLFLVSVSVDSFGKHLRARSFFFFIILYYHWCASCWGSMWPGQAVKYTATRNMNILLLPWGLSFGLCLGSSIEVRRDKRVWVTFKHDRCPWTQRLKRDWYLKCWSRPY